MYKIVVLILLAAFFSTGCKRKTPEAKFLTDVAVIRQSAENGNAKKTADGGGQDSFTDRNRGSDTHQSEEPRVVYHIIVGSYLPQDKAKAEWLVRNLRELGHPAELLPEPKHQGYRVSIENYPTQKQAMARKHEIEEITDRTDLWLVRIEN